ncbi:MAG: putative porin [Gemmatimonadota bacterium]|nr:putative porin [Gemmatimonadota bacterium]
MPGWVLVQRVTLSMWMKGFLLCVCITGTWDGVAQSNITADRLTWSGTVRMRWEGDFQNGTRARNVLQYGLRLDTTLRASARIDLVGRLMTGNPRAIVTSEWVKAGDFLMNKNPHISWLYAQVRPVPSITLIGGKFPMPFFKPTQVVLDPDLSPEGLAQRILVQNANKSAAFGLNFAEILINQASSRTRDVSHTYFIGAQALGRFTQPNRSQTIAVALYAFGQADSIYSAQNLKSPRLIVAPNSNRANAGKTGFLSNFRMINVSARYTQTVYKKPLTFNVDYVINTGALDKRHGITGVVTYGSTGPVDGTRAGIQAFHMDQDATLAAFSNIDYAQTNTNGIGFFVGCHLIENLIVDLIVYLRKYDSPGTLISPVTNNAWRTRGRFMLTFRM